MFQSKSKQFLLLFVVAGIAGMIVNPHSPTIEEVHFGVFVGSFIGTALALSLITFFLSLIPSGIYRFVKGSWPQWLIWLCFPLLIPFLYLSNIGTTVQAPAGQVTANAEPHVFDETPCEYTVRFPEIPDYQNVTFPGIGEAVQATLAYDSGAFMRVECPDFGETWDGYQFRAFEEDWVDWMGNYMEAQAFTNIQISEPTQVRPQVPRIITGKGFKEVDSVHVTYKVRVVAGNRSVLFMYAGEPTNVFPTRSISQFLESYQPQ